MWLSGLLRMCRWADTLRSWLSLHLSVIGGFLSLAFWKPTTVLEGWGALQWCAQPCVTVWEMAGPWTWWLTVGEATFCTWKVTKWGSVGMWQGCPKRRDGQRRNSLQSDAAFCLTFWPCLVEIGLTGSFIIIFFYFDQILFFFLVSKCRVLKPQMCSVSCWRWAPHPLRLQQWMLRWQNKQWLWSLCSLHVPEMLCREREWFP